MIYGDATSSVCSIVLKMNIGGPRTSTYHFMASNYLLSKAAEVPWASIRLFTTPKREYGNLMT